MKEWSSFLPFIKQIESCFDDKKLLVYFLNFNILLQWNTIFCSMAEDSGEANVYKTDLTVAVISNYPFIMNLMIETHLECKLISSVNIIIPNWTIILPPFDLPVRNGTAYAPLRTKQERTIFRNALWRI